jgi:hypothetical protein
VTRLGRKEWPTRKGESGRAGVGTIGAKENPAGVSLRGVVGDLVDQLPARADRINRRVNNRQRARYPITRNRGFMVQRKTCAIEPSGSEPETKARFHGLFDGGMDRSFQSSATNLSINWIAASRWTESPDNS